MTKQSATTKHNRRWFQFSLKTLLATMLLVGIGLGWLAREREHVRRRLAAINAVNRAGGHIEYNTKRPFRPVWLRPLVGDTTPGEVEGVFLQYGSGDFELRHLDGLTALKSLSLKTVRLSNADLPQLTRTYLELLELRGIGITDDGLEHLPGFTSLNHVVFCETRVTYAGARWLKERMPNIRIDFENNPVIDSAPGR